MVFCKGPQHPSPSLPHEGTVAGPFQSSALLETHYFDVALGRSLLLRVEYYLGLEAGPGACLPGEGTVSTAVNLGGGGVEGRAPQPQSRVHFYVFLLFVEVVLRGKAKLSGFEGGLLRVGVDLEAVWLPLAQHLLGVLTR